MIRYQRAHSEASTLDPSSSEPLRSTRRHDGLWESIETDDNITPANEPAVLAATKDCVSCRTHVSSKSIGVQTSPQPFPVPTNFSPENSSTNPEPDFTAQTTRLSGPNHLVVTSNLGDMAGESTPTDGPRRRRGRPKNPAGFRHRRSVRFSDPVSSEYEPNPATRVAHIFVRVLFVVIEEKVGHLAEGAVARRRQEFSWNNRGKGWRAADRRSDEGLVQIVSLFDLAAGGGVEIFPIILPTERGGARQPVRMAWDREKACFLGTNQDGEILLVALGEMKDMARDPWARQFVGYITS